MLSKKTDHSYSTSAPALQVRVEMHGRTAILAPHGEVDHHSVPALDQALSALPARRDAVLLDMSAVAFMDSAGLDFLRRLHAYGRQNAIVVMALHWRGQPRRLMEHSGCCHQERSATTPASLRLVPDLPNPPAPADEAARLRKEIQQLRRAIESRPVIDQARGIVMALGPCTSDAAWQLLVEVSQHTNTKLREVADALVTAPTGRSLPAPLQTELGRALHRLRAAHP